MKKNIILYSIFLLVIMTNFQSCKKHDEHPVPFIESISPAQGAVGTPVTITGKNFGGTVSGNEVKFNGVAATLTSATSTQLITTVPTGASTGKVTVKVGDKIATSSTEFTVVSAPVNNPAITSFSPSSGAAGTQVIITGSNFSTTLADNVVKFNNQVATVTAATTTQLTVTVPASASTGKITITINGVVATSGSDFTVPNSPVIASFSPSSGSVGTQVIITGANFSSTPTDNVVKFNNTTATVTAATATQLTVTLPASASTGKITVTINSAIATSATDFTVISAPTITSFSPSSGVVGAQVIITGNNFSTTPASNTVKFNNTVATVSAATTTQLTVTVPAGATTGKISVTVNSLTVTSATDFAIVLPPTITSFSPSTAMTGAQVIITGTNFSTTASENTVTFFNNKVASVTNATATQLTVTVPSGATTGKISVTTNTLTAMSSTDFTVSTSPVSVQSYSPAMGLAGDVITITGTSFSTTLNENQVLFGGNVVANVTAATSTSLTVTVPLTATTGAIKVTVGASSATGASSFEILQDIPRNGLVAFYPFSGNTQDASGNGFNLSYNGATSTTADRFGLADKAYYFVGGNAYALATTTSQAMLTQPLTLSAWIKYDALIGSSILSKYDLPGGYIVSLLSNGGIEFYMDGGVYAQSNAGILPSNSAGQWIMITVTFDGSTAKFYKNGSLSTTVAISGQVTANATSGRLRVGLSGATSGTVFACSIDDVVNYNRILSAAEVQQLYTATVSKK